MEGAQVLCQPEDNRVWSGHFFFLPMQCFISSNKIIVRCKAGTQIFTTVDYDARFIIYIYILACVLPMYHLPPRVKAALVQDSRNRKSSQEQPPTNRLLQSHSGSQWRYSAPQSVRHVSGNSPAVPSSKFEGLRRW